MIKNKPKNISQINAQKIAQLEEKLKRSLADYSNLEKRIENQKEFFANLAAAAVMTKMIDVLDDLYRAQDHLKDQGLQMAIDRFVAVLRSEGLEELNPQGQVFDPITMDCVDVASGQQDLVVSVNKKGYRLGDHVVRPAQVIVGREKQN